ncbi:MAG: cation:proton antiporter [Magnetococcales bacterium]|nr:cation:proton antiporter [Magnetococcales bacterium]
MTSIAIFFVQALLVVSLPYAVWRYSGIRRMIPLVVVQILVGILVGPSVLGEVTPEVWSLLFTDKTLVVLKGLSWLAVVLFAFLTGLHLKPSEMNGMGKTFGVVSLSSLIFPFLLGGCVGFWVAYAYPASLGPKANAGQFAIGFGLCTSVTALPVLGAILRETGLLQHRIGNLSLGIAAVSDAALWFFLGILLLNISNPPEGTTLILWMPVLACIYFGLILLIRKPLSRQFQNSGMLNEQDLVLVCTLIFGSAVIAESIGLHATLGGFLVGVILPRHATRNIIAILEPVTVVVLLPFFFTLTGMHTHFETGQSDWVVITLVAILISVVGKVAATALPARILGESWLDSFSLGLLLQTKGMMEVVVLTILLEVGILSFMAFSSLLAMAIITTALTTPLLHLPGGLLSHRR